MNVTAEVCALLEAAHVLSATETLVPSTIVLTDCTSLLHSLQGSDNRRQMLQDIRRELQLLSFGTTLVTVGSWHISTGSKSPAQTNARVVPAFSLLSTSSSHAAPLQNSDVKPGRSRWTCGRNCVLGRSPCGGLLTSPWCPV